MKQSPRSEISNAQTLQLRSELLESLQRAGYKNLTPIQARSLEIIFQGKDLIAQAKTGSGKTAAFALGILHQIDFSQKNPQALILCPTRELARQVAQEIRMLASTIQNVNIVELCGGSPESKQKKLLQKPAHILVGTPGRIKSLQEKSSLPSQALRILVLDEADAMLDLGFHDEIHSIAKGLPNSRQTLLFSASYPQKIQTLSKALLHNPSHIVVEEHHDKNIIKEQFIVCDHENQKSQHIETLLRAQHTNSTLIFCQTKATCHALAKTLQEKGFSTGLISGDLEQRDRITMLTKFSNKSFEVLVATDVASRGLDIKNVQLVINYNLPHDFHTHTHRIGRTGRAGKTGQAISFYTDDDRDFIKQWEEKNQTSLPKADLSNLGKTKKEAPQEKITTIYISGGKKDKLRPGDILGALVKVAKIPGEAVGDINIGEKNTYVAIQETYAQQAINILLANKIKKKKFKVGRA